MTPALKTLEAGGSPAFSTKEFPAQPRLQGKSVSEKQNDSITLSQMPG